MYRSTALICIYSSDSTVSGWLLAFCEVTLSLVADELSTETLPCLLMVQSCRTVCTPLEVLPKELLGLVLLCSSPESGET
jgi:hypothetical protein